MGSGGAIKTNYGKLNLVNSSFLNNSATIYGGAIYSDYYGSTLGTISSSTFINNYANVGGGVYNYANFGIYDKSVFINNSANMYPDIYGASKINNSIFLSPKFFDLETDVIHKGYASNLEIINSWFGNTKHNYTTKPISNTPISVWYYLDIDTDTDYHAIVSLKLYNSTTQTVSINENYNLPEFILKLTKTNLVFDESEIKLNKTGQYDVQYTASSTIGSITAQYETAKLTETVALTDFEKLKKLIDDVNAGDVIELSRNYTYDVDLDTIVDGININKKLTINGNGYTIDAKGKSRIFNIQSGASGLILNNITFANAKAESGGAIYSGCNNVNIVNCSFVNNSATSGGAIYSNKYYLNVENSTFVDNTAGYGAAIYNLASSSTVNNCTFAKNNANGQAVVLNFADNFKLDKSFFIENVATNGYYDAIFRTTYSNTVVSNSIFLNNKGKIFNGNGGTFTADYNWYGYTEDNYTADPNTGITLNNWYYFEMDTSTENHIIVSMKLWDKSSSSINENYTLRNITFNISQKNLGIDETEIKLNKTGQYDLEYELTSDNGLVTVQFETIEITKYLGNGDFDILQNLISASNDNDVIVLTRDYEYTAGLDTITEGIFVDKTGLTIDGNGHTIDAKQLSRIFNIDSNALRVTIKNINLVNGKSSGNGGAINWQGAFGNIINTTFKENTANYGGAVYVHSFDYEIINSTFINNTAYYGGALSFYTNANIYNSTFIENNARQHGGAIHVFYRNVKIDKSLFIKNTANLGGAIRWAAGENGNISNSIFLDNLANGGSNNIDFYSDIPVADYNWFGNTKDNYQNNFTSSNLIINNWLFLNATYDNPMIIGKDNVVKFVFRVYNETGVSDYNSSKVHDFDLTLTSVNGETDKNNVLTNENIAYTPNSAGAGSITAKNGDVELTVNFDNKYLTEINVNESFTLYVDEIKDIGAILNPAGGNLIYSSDNGNVSVSQFGQITGEHQGTSNLTIKFAGNTTHAPASAVVLITVLKYDTHFINTPVIIDYGSWKNLIVYLDLGDHVIDSYYMGVSYESNDTDIVTVDNQGRIIGENAGKANITIKFAGTNKYNPSEVNITVTVNKIDSEITFSNNITFDYLSQNTTAVTVDGGSVDLTNISVVSHPEAIITLNDNVITVSNLDAGNYTLKVVTTPDSNHNSVEGTVNITVNKIKSGIVFSNEVVFDYLSSNSTTVTLTGAVSVGDVVVLNHPEAVVSVDDNVITVSNLSAGSYILNVTSVPDGNHIAVSGTVGITVNRIKSGIVFSNEVVFDYLSSNSTTVILTGASGVTKIEVLNHPEAIINLNDNVITVSNLDAGSYTLNVTSVPDGNHIAVSGTVGITVNRIKSGIVFSNEVVFDYLSSNSTTVTLTGASGVSDVVVLNHPEAVVSVNDNVITVSNLNAGNYTLKVATVPDFNHLSFEGTVNITVNKIKSEIIFTNNIIFDYLSSNSTTVILTGASGVSDVVVLNHPEAVVSVNDNVITVSNLSAGSYTLNVTTVPDDNHIAVSGTASITVNKIGSQITFSNNIIFDYLSNNITAVTVTGGSIDLENISVTGHNEAIITLKNNIINISGLDAGEYTLKVISTPDFNHKTAEATATITVNKIDSQIILNDIEYEYGSTGTGIITVNGGSIDVENITVVDKHANIELDTNTLLISGLDNGTYTLKVISTPDKNHNSVEKTVQLKVNINRSYNYYVNAKSLTISWGDNATLTATSDVAGLNGIVNYYDLSDNNKYLGSANLNELINFTYLTVGAHNINATFEGAPNYGAKWLNITLLVDKVHENEFEVTVTPNNYIYGESAIITATVKYDDATGNVSYYIDGKFYRNATINSEGLIINNLTAGHTYEITARYAGDVNYDEDTLIRYIEVSKAASIVKIDEISQVNWPNDIIINYNTVNRTTLTISVKSKTDVEFELTQSDENIIITDNEIRITGLKAGEYRITINNNENDNYTSDSDTKDFTVNKISSTISVENIKFDFESSATITAEITGATALTNVVIEGYENSIRVNGLNITVSGLNAGTYILSATTVPDENHTAATINVNVTVNKINSTITLSDVIFDYDSYNKTTVSVTGASGIVASVLGYDSAVTVGGFDITVSNLDAGTYILSATTIPDDNHLSATAVSIITVNKINSTLALSDIVFDYGGFNKTSVTVSGALGIVASVLGYDGAVIVDGFDITVSNLDAGSYILSVSTVTDGNHNSVTGVSRITVNKVNSTLELSDIVFDYGGFNKTTVNADGASGIVASVLGYDGAVIVDGFDIIVSNLDAGSYILSVSTVTDGNHNSVTGVSRITVNKVNSTLELSDIVFDYGGFNKTSVGVSGASGIVASVLGYDGAVIVDGFDIIVSNLDAGSYILSVSTVTDSNHNPVTEVSKITVNKINSTLTIANDIIFDVGGYNTTIVTYAGATGVTANIIGENSATVKVENTNITVSNLKAGEYTLTVTTVTDSNHNNVTKTAKVTVKKHDTGITANPVEAKAGQSVTITVSLPEDATGYVLLEVADIKTFAEIKDNNPIFIINNLPAGEYTANITYLGDDKYNNETVNVNVKINELKVPEIDLTVSNNTAGEDLNITVKLPSDASGEVTVYIDGKKYDTVSAENAGKGIIVSDLTSGEHYIEAVYTGDENYTSKSLNKTVEILKKDTLISVSGNNVTFKSKTTLTVDITDGATGIVILNINGTEYSINISETKTLEIVLDKPGIYELFAKYPGDDKYNPKESQKVNIKVNDKKPANLELNIPQNIKTGDNVIITVKSDSNSPINVFVNGEEKTVSDGKITIEKISTGNYTIVADVDENTQYYGDQVIKSFEINKKQAEIIITVPENIKVGQNIKIKVESYENADISVLVDGVSYEVNESAITINNIRAGNHTILVKTIETDEYFETSANKIFTVLKEPVLFFTIEGTPTKAGEKSTITLVTDNNENAIAIVNINGTEYAVNLTGGYAIFDIVLDNAGSYPISARYLENDKYLSGETTGKPIIVTDKNNAEITVEIPKVIYAGETITINVSCTSEITNVLINGENKEINDGKITIENIPAGIYTVQVNACENSDYYSTELIKTFEVIKNTSPITITVPENIKAGDNVEIKVKAYDGADITVYIDGVKYEGSVKNISYGNHTVTANTPENDLYLPSTANKTFTVTKHDSVITVNGYNVKVGEKTTITVNLTEKATGIVIVNVNGTEYALNISKTNKLEIVLDTEGDYDISAVYLGDDKFNSNSSAVKTITAVNKKDSAIKINANDENIKVTLPQNATGNVKITVDGKPVNITKNGNDYTADITGIKPGKHTVEVNYDGDSEYSSNSTLYEFEVSKIKPEISAQANEITDNQKALINITVNEDAHGIILINIDGKNYYAEIKNGKTNLEIDGLTCGTHTATLNYNGDDKYQNTSTTLNIKVNPRETPKITIELTQNPVAGSIVYSTVKMPNDIEGNFTLIVDGDEIGLFGADNIVSASLGNLNAGTHTVEIIYNGDDKYSPANINTTFTVSKISTDIKAEADETTEGQSAIINIALDNNSNGLILVEINGNRLYGELKDGKTTIEVNNLPAGEYVATITYNGDDNYAGKTQTVNVKVKKLTVPDIKITVPGETEAGKPVEITMEMPENATGNVAVFIDGKQVTNNEITSSKITLNDLTSGEHTVEVRYSGDENYAPASKITDLTVKKLSTEISAENVKFIEGETGYIYVTLENIDAEGIVLVKINDLNLYGEIEYGVAVIELKGLTAGNYIVGITYSGNDKFEISKTTANVEVVEKTQKINPSLNVYVPNTVEKGQIPTADIELPSDATGTVSVIVDGNKIYEGSAGGISNVSLGNMSSGAHLVEIQYSGDDKYNPITVTKAVAVGSSTPAPAVKKDTFLSADATLTRVANDNTKAGETGGDYYVTLTDSDRNPLVNKTVQIAINGVHYFVQTDEWGRAHQTVSMESANVYTYAFAFQGDDEYNAAPLNSTRLTVTKKTTTITAKAKTFKAAAKSKKITVTLTTSKNPYDGKTYLASGKKLTLTVGGKTYSGKTDSKNQVTFTIKLTKKGKYTGKIKFAGSKIYAACSTSVKITLK